MKKAKVTGYRSPLVVVGTIGGESVVIRIPCNVAKPIIGAEIPVKPYASGVLAAVYSGAPDALKRDPKKTVEESVWIYEASAVGK